MGTPPNRARPKRSRGVSSHAPQTASQRAHRQPPAGFLSAPSLPLRASTRAPRALDQGAFALRFQCLPARATVQPPRLWASTCRTALDARTIHCEPEGNSEEGLVHGRAVILAGGKGSRLAPYTTVIPKPLMPIGDRAILDVIVRQLRETGFTELTLAVGYLAHLIKAVFGDGSALRRTTSTITTRRSRWARPARSPRSRISTSRSSR